MIIGTPTFISRSLCDGGSFVRWRRTHKNNRIAKKWRKRYGMVVTKCSRVVVKMPGKFVLCPCAQAALKEALPTTYHDRFKEPGML